MSPASEWREASVGFGRRTFLYQKTMRGPVGYTDKWLSYLLSREAINCDDETYRVESKEAYWDDGTNLSAPEVSLPTAWKPILPESRAEVEMRLVCAWKPK